MLLHYLRKFKIKILCRYSVNMEENVKKLHFQSTDFNSCTCITVHAQCAYVFLSKSCPCCCEYHVDCWQTLLWRISGATNWSQKQTSKWTVTWKILFGISMGKTRYFRHRKYQNFGMNNKVRGDKNAIRFHFLPNLLNICRKFEFVISQGIVATCLRWGG